MTEPFIHLAGVSKVYRTGRKEHLAISDASFDVMPGERVCKRLLATGPGIALTAVTTGGGVAFLSSTLDYYIRGYDVSNGKVVWKARLPAGGQATPMTYLGADGRQYLLVVAGGHGSLGTQAGDDILAYALPAR